MKETPTSTGLRELVKDQILSKDEAREILFNLEEPNERDIKSLEQEIKFLRDVIQRLTSRSEIVTIIKKVEKPYREYYWYKPYWTWSYGDSVNLCGSSDLVDYSGTTTYTTSNSNFTDIKTF